MWYCWNSTDPQNKVCHLYCTVNSKKQSHILLCQWKNKTVTAGKKKKGVISKNRCVRKELNKN